jgi:hypothetical protein
LRAFRNRRRAWTAPLLCLLAFWAPLGTAPALGQPKPGDDPFAQSQQETVPALAAAPSGLSFTFRGFVDVGYINITQTRPPGSGGDLSWAYGNSQFAFPAAVNTFSVNEVALIFQGQREYAGRLVGATADVAFYPSRDQQLYLASGADREFQVAQAYAFVEFPSVWSTRILLGRAAGFLTLEQQEGRAPDLRIIGHTYVFQAGGGYPNGLQVRTHPGKPFTIKLGASNGGVGDYSFFPGDRSTTNLAVANHGDPKADPKNKPNGMTASGAVDWVLFDRPADFGTFRVGIGAASNPSLTYNSVKDRAEPYAFSNAYLGYRVSDFELRAENAQLRAYYATSLGLFDATMYSALLSYEPSPNHMFTLRNEGISYVTDLDAKKRGQGTKNGLSYRYRIAPPAVLKLEYVTEDQSPQFWRISDGKSLTTNVAAASWVYSF